MISELVYRNRSYRRFYESKRITHSQLIQIMETARFIPSAGNLQKLCYYLIEERSECDKMFPHLKWASYLKKWNGPEPGERPSAYIIILVPKSCSNMVYIDTGIAAQTILLTAVDNGLGGCLLASVDKDAVHKIFLLPDNMDIVLVIALGYPAETVVIEDVTDQDKIEYWRDENTVHHVPKRKLSDLILNY
ncbi:MAG TPA: nitroreductase family protein [Candidatus Cloacimonas sp.]|jgi:nitroreductase|nr:nitroreductase family protein [Candidatus Cloacimonas sp.]MDD2250266.1 nitroreductase family protein [Candidatus Cloacimonadota bacterium]MCK9158177.1 nitroreductase family protein [Candidatus Cloacimonas sp.]MCK9165281.1 nitroreductase family protein [Candidatus Cloacimonas sp.]MDD3734332.1 nitroreductase family protein [Candidatus Cloacimonadota bacterium]